MKQFKLKINMRNRLSNAPHTHKHTHTHTHLPHWFDAFLEEVDVTVWRQLTWPSQVAVVGPKLLHLPENWGGGEMRATIRNRGLGRRIVSTRDLE